MESQPSSPTKKDRSSQSRGAKYHYAEEIQNIASNEEGVDFQAQVEDTFNDMKNILKQQIAVIEQKHQASMQHKKKQLDKEL
jgi:hypothetical protein